MPFQPSSITRLRDSAGLTQYGLAVNLGCRPETISNWERGRSVPNANWLERLVDFSQQHNQPLVYNDFFQPPGPVQLPLFPS